MRLIPENPWQQFVIEARDANGNVTSREFYFEGIFSEETVLLRPERPVYRVGDTMNLTILTSQQRGTVYLDIVREGQTVSTRSVEVANGHADFAIDLTPDLYGTLELHAYKILRSGTIARDTRLVVVDNAAGLDIAFSADSDVYRPGDTASLDIQVSGVDGAGARTEQGVRAALGIAIVDESVFALAEQDPGFAKLYFLLEEELLQPKYDLHGFSVPDLVGGVPVSAESLVTAIEDTAQASLSAATPQSVRFSLEANSHQEAMQRAFDRQENYFGKLSVGLYGLFLALPLSVLGVNVYALWRDKHLVRSLGFLLG